MFKDCYCGYGGPPYQSIDSSRHPPSAEDFTKLRLSYVFVFLLLMILPLVAFKFDYKVVFALD